MSFFQSLRPVPLATSGGATPSVSLSLATFGATPSGADPDAELKASFDRSRSTWDTNWARLKGLAQPLSHLYADSLIDRKKLTQGLSLLQFEQQLKDDPILIDKDATIPGLLHTCCGDRIVNDEALLHRSVFGAHFSGFDVHGEPKVEFFCPLGGGLEYAPTTFHVTLDHLLHKDDFFKRFQLPGGKKPLRLVFADLSTHVGITTDGCKLSSGAVAESANRTARSACGAILGSLKKDDKNQWNAAPPLVRIRKSLMVNQKQPNNNDENTDTNLAYLNRMLVNAENNLDSEHFAIKAAVLSVDAAVQNFLDAALHDHDETDSLYGVHVTGTVIVNNEEGAMVGIQVARALVLYKGYYDKHKHELKRVVVFDDIARRVAPSRDATRLQVRWTPRGANTEANLQVIEGPPPPIGGQMKSKM